MSRSVAQDYDRYRDPKHVSEVLAEAFRRNPTPGNLEKWVDSQPLPGQGELELVFCDEVNSEFRRD